MVSSGREESLRAEARRPKGEPEAIFKKDSHTGPPHDDGLRNATGPPGTTFRLGKHSSFSVSAFSASLRENNLPFE